MAFNVSDRYKEVIYGGDYTHKLRVWFNEIELENADLYCESLKVKKRLLPESNSGFSLHNFYSQNIEMVMHDIDEEIIVSPIRISISTLVDGEFEEVPIGIFNIQDQPTTDKNKITFTASDNAIKFDFGYNALEIMYDEETRETHPVTKLQIFNNICEKAGVETNITDFIGSNDLIGVYDNEITAREYICMLAEQSGSIPTINRFGELIFIDIKNLYTWEIPLDIVESYSYGLHYEVGKIVYESGIIKYETEDSELDTLYLDATNLYVNENTINLIKDKLLGFEIDSFKTGKLLGNPAIDHYDLIRIIDEESTFITLANYELTYKGNMLQPITTEFTKDKIESNVSKTRADTFKKWAKTTIDSIEGTIEFTTGKVNDLEQLQNNNYQDLLDKFSNIDVDIAKIESLETSVRQLQTDTYTKTEVNQIASGIGVDGQVVSAVITTSGTFDENGMTYEKSNAKTKATINEVGVNVKDSSNKSLLFAGYVDENNQDYQDYVGQTIVGTDNTIIRNYLEIGTHSRVQDYEDGTGVFYKGGRF